MNSNYSQIIIFSLSLRLLKDTGGHLTHWSLFLQQFELTIVYKKGSNNTNADALSWRPPNHQPTVSAVGTCIPLADSDTLANAQQDDSTQMTYIHTVVPRSLRAVVL